ncbi:hypothetical protein [Lysinibacillus sp. NPDC096259]
MDALDFAHLVVSEAYQALIACSMVVVPSPKWGKEFCSTNGG